MKKNKRKKQFSRRAFRSDMGCGWSGFYGWNDGAGWYWDYGCYNGLQSARHDRYSYGTW